MKYAFTRPDRLAAIRIVAIYAVVSALWIYLSDTALGVFVRNPAHIVRIGVFKGFFFIIVTGLLLYKLIAGHIRKSLRDMAELKRKERELREKNAELESFTYMVSHDLKSPLVTVNTFLGYLEQDLERSNTDRIDQDISYIRAATDKMGQLLDDLLELSRIGKVINPRVQVTFGEAVDSALGLMAGAISERGVMIRVYREPIVLYGDRLRLVGVWQNLLENAVKFMGDQPAPLIEIGAESNDGDTVFYVRDNGMGIDHRFQAKIFGLFEKLDQKSEGTGLGLALIKRIVELNHGTIRVESAGAGQGACFLFTLPDSLKCNPEVEKS